MRHTEQKVKAGKMRQKRLGGAKGKEEHNE